MVGGHRSPTSGPSGSGGVYYSTQDRGPYKKQGLCSCLLVYIGSLLHVGECMLGALLGMRVVKTLPDMG